MSASRPLKISNPTLTRNNDVLDEATPRLVLGMDGEVLFSNAASDAFAGYAIKGLNFFDIAQFENIDDAFRHSPMMFSDSGPLLSCLRSGSHIIAFSDTGERLELQFDVVGANDDAQQYVIASALEHDEGFTQTVERMLCRAEQNNQSADERMLAQFLAISDDLLCVSGPSGAFETVSERFTTLLGFSGNDLTGRTFLDLVHPDDRAAVRGSMQELMYQTASQGVTFECRLISNEARSYWTEWKHRKADGKIYSAGRDVTAIKRHEQALMKRQQQLLEAEAIGHMGHWHWTIGEQDIEFSDEIYRVFGVSREKFKPTLDSVNAMLHRRDVGRMMQAFQRAIIEQNDHEIDFRILTPTGDVRHIRCQGRCEFDASGEVTGLYGIMQDVTESMAHERALREAKESAERAYAAKSQFLANMSHELRTPLNAIIGFSEMMQQQLLGPIGNDRYLDYIKGIRESGEHLLDLITDILDMSKIEAGKYELALEQVNAEKIIRLAAHMVESRAAESGIKIGVYVPEDTVHMVVDRRAVMQIILNLLSNAVKFSHQNGRVDIECGVRGDHVIIRVKDNGIGIPASKLQTITNPFEQAANQYSRGHEGSGLGLSITKELTELHGGVIHIESQVNVGTIVTVRLPIDATATRRDAGQS